MHILFLPSSTCQAFFFLFTHSPLSIFFPTTSLFTPVFPTLLSTHFLSLMFSCYTYSLFVYIYSLVVPSLLLLCIVHVPASLPRSHPCPPLSPPLFPGRSVCRSLRSSSAAPTYITRFLWPPDKIARGATPGECESRWYAAPRCLVAARTAEKLLCTPDTLATFGNLLLPIFFFFFYLRPLKEKVCSRLQGDGAISVMDPLVNFFSYFLSKK